VIGWSMADINAMFWDDFILEVIEAHTMAGWD
jgi:hypothetical protein